MSGAQVKSCKIGCMLTAAAAFVYLLGLVPAAAERTESADAESTQIIEIKPVDGSSAETGTEETDHAASAPDGGAVDASHMYPETFKTSESLTAESAKFKEADAKLHSDQGEATKVSDVYAGSIKDVKGSSNSLHKAVQEYEQTVSDTFGKHVEDVRGQIKEGASAGQSGTTTSDGAAATQAAAPKDEKESEAHEGDEGKKEEAAEQPHEGGEQPHEGGEHQS
eukprot:gnl/TRDRNA2_/TRDRNA2_154125_c0_seq1.p2 gnl/TRDRNA2_/TRDRNA2_154125_c0~~gnl/TRDRNA2_/TRDRNA2_154125_c0_seq1.p2  ORF type:complete len:223 (-),score=59.15 gnl/TRDRNA2_/TRDRNA2_154125_c0_seq1:181-849(-)